MTGREQNKSEARSLFAQKLDYMSQLVVPVHLPRVAPGRGPNKYKKNYFNWLL